MHQKKGMEIMSKYPFDNGDYCVECQHCVCGDPWGRPEDLITSDGRFNVRCKYKKDPISVLEVRTPGCLRKQDGLPVSRREKAYDAYLKWLKKRYLTTFVYTVIREYLKEKPEELIILQRESGLTIDEEERILGEFVASLKTEYLFGRFGADYDLFGSLVAENLKKKSLEEQFNLAMFLRKRCLLEILELLMSTKTLDEENSYQRKLLAAEKYRIMFEYVCMGNGIISPTFGGDKRLSFAQL